MKKLTQKNTLIQILEDIKNDIIYSKEENKSPSGKNINQLKKDKKIPIKSSCSNLSLYIANKLYKNGIENKIILSKRKDILHFCIKAEIDNEIVFIDENKGNFYIYNSIPDNSKILFTSLSYKGEETINELFSNEKIFQIGLLIKSSIHKILPRQWNIGINKEKDSKKEILYNKLLKKGKVIEK